MENKGEVSILLPYQMREGEAFVFLQKRSMTFKILPGHLAFFGGKMEAGESPVEGLEREIKEELGFVPKNYTKLGDYFFRDGKLAHIYFLEVGKEFENKIKVMEGDYGKFFSQVEILREPMMIDSDKKIVGDLFEHLKNGQ